MPLLPPGHAAAMPHTESAPPPIDNPMETATPPPIPGATAPPPISPSIHQPDDEPADIHVVSDVPPPAAVHETEPPPIPDMHSTAPGTPPPVMDTTPPAPPAAAAPPAVAEKPPVPSGMQHMPAGTAAAGGKVLQELAEEGFEGLDIGFGSFPVVRLQDTNFSTNDDEALGSEFYCVIHASRTKWLLKAEDDNKCNEFVYSHDQEFTTSGKAISEVLAEWKAKGYDSPVWKKYLDVTAQRFNKDDRTIGDVVILSIPNNSVNRLTGYLTTVKLGKGLAPSAVVTHVHLGQKVTNAVKPFYPWAFKLYAPLSQLGL